VITSSFTELFNKNKVLEMNFAYTNRHTTSDRDAFDYNPSSKEFDLINKQQTNYFENDLRRPALWWQFQVSLKRSIVFKMGTAVQTSQISSRSIRGIYHTNGKDSVINTYQRSTNLFPTANFNL